jgi:hypothetical protein
MLQAVCVIVCPGVLSALFCRAVFRRSLRRMYDTFGKRLAGRRTLSMSLAYSSTVAMRQRIIGVLFFKCSICGQASKYCRRGGVERGDEVFAEVLGILRQLQVSR